MEGCIEGIKAISYVSRSCAAVEVGLGGDTASVQSV